MFLHHFAYYFYAKNNYTSGGHYPELINMNTGKALCIFSPSTSICSMINSIF